MIGLTVGETFGMSSHLFVWLRLNITHIRNVTLKLSQGLILLQVFVISQIPETCVQQGA